jgi:hypothetical protein
MDLPGLTWKLKREWAKLMVEGLTETESAIADFDLALLPSIWYSLIVHREITRDFAVGMYRSLSCFSLDPYLPHGRELKQKGVAPVGDLIESSSRALFLFFQ